MKKIIILSAILCISALGFSQNPEAIGYTIPSLNKYPKNEIRYNIFNTMLIASVEIGYARFVDSNQSVEASILFNDRMNYGIGRKGGSFETTSFKVGYNFYFENTYSGSGAYANPFLKYRFGDFRETKNGKTITTDMNTFVVGIGIGYTWNFNHKFIIGPYANIGRNFSKEVKERFTFLEFNAGLNVGYRF